MDIQKELAESNRKMEEIVKQINALAVQGQRIEQQRQELVQEARRLEGEVRGFKRLEAQEKAEKVKGK